MSEYNSELPQHNAPLDNMEPDSEQVIKMNVTESGVLDNATDSKTRQTDETVSHNASEIVEEEGSKTLEEALEKYGVELSAKKVRLLKEYCELLWTWNERLNLTRHTSFDKFVSRDLIDSIHLANLLQKGEHVLDVGSGGGVPGLVVAILRPDVVVELCDATGKKAEALGAIVDELGLDLNIWYAKAEDLLKTRRFHTLTVRAVGKMRSLLLMFAPVWHTFNRLLLIKGPNWIAERGEARHYNMFNSLALRKVDEYMNPGADHASVILQICRKTRMEEMERRAKERIEGLPYDGQIEEIVVDNTIRDYTNVEGGQRRPRRGAPRAKSSRRQDSRPSVKSQERSSSLSSENTNRSSNRTNKSEDLAQFSSRRKAPKGWTGKKSDFHDASGADGKSKRFGDRSNAHARFNDKHKPGRVNRDSNRGSSRQPRGDSPKE
mgnify:CR=1 FL=1